MDICASFSSGLTFVALSRVKALDSIIVDQVDYCRVQKLGGNQRAYTANGGPEQCHTRDRARSGRDREMRSVGIAID